MSINNNNYETYLIDYLDGKLNLMEVSEVLLFLEQNPHIKAELEGFESVTCIDEKEISFDPSDLKKPVYADVKKDYEQLLVAELENDLTDTDRSILSQAKKYYPDLNKDAELFIQTKLKAETISFPFKKDLKKSVVVPLYRQTWLRVAATLLVVSLAGLVWISFNNATFNNSRTAAVDLPGQEHPDRTTSPDVKNTIKTAGISGITVNKQTSAAHGLNQSAKSHSALPIAVRHIKTEMISLKKTGVAEKCMALNIPELPVIKGQLNNAKSFASHDEYTDVKDLAVRQIEKQKGRLLGKNENGELKSLLEAINTATGENVKIDKNESGKIKRFEIAGLGFEWSQSK